MKGKLLIPLIFLLSLLVSSEVFASETSVSAAPVTAVSPTDGSLWVGTSSQGILRFGRNGRSIRYSVASGHLHSDQVLSLSFDASGRLYVLDGSGCVWTYSSLEGFSEVSGFTGGVSALCLSADHTYIYIVSGDKLFSLSEGQASQLAQLPFAPVALVAGADGALWLSGPQGVCRWADGNATQLSGDLAPAAVLPYRFQVEDQQPEQPAAQSSFSVWTALLWLIIGLALALLLKRKKAEEEAPMIKEVKPVNPVKPLTPVKPEVPAEKKASVVEKAPVEEKIPVAKKVPDVEHIEEALEASAFGRELRALVVAHLANPNYGVEEVAQDLGLSRIHVNRKLKAETGYSPSAVFKFIRMNQASKLLKEGRMTIADVAKECGFASASYFSTAFKEYFNQSPSDFLAQAGPTTGTLNL